MPCAQDHDHPPWPTSGVHELVVQPCETQCGWCNYKTEHANNLRVHARRHIANLKDENLKGITVAKCKAGRTRTQMAPTGSRKRRHEVSASIKDDDESPLEGDEYRYWQEQPIRPEVARERYDALVRDAAHSLDKTYQAWVEGEKHYKRCMEEHYKPYMEDIHMGIMINEAVDGRLRDSVAIRGALADLIGEVDLLSFDLPIPGLDFIINDRI